jgi:hypothetical protein
LLDGGHGLLARQLVGQAASDAGKRQEGDHRDARQQRQRYHQEGRQAERTGIAAELSEQGLVGGPGDTSLGNQQARAGRDDQCRNLRDQAIADRQQGIGLGRIVQRQILLEDADDDAADDIDESDQ